MVSQDDIYDRSTAGGLGTSIACAKSAWFLFQTIAQVAHSLPITTLEIATLPFIGCTWLTNFFWWAKPMDMETFTTIHVHHIPPEQLCRLMEATCFRGATCDWYRPCVKKAHPYKWDNFFLGKPMNLKTLTVVDVSHLLADAVYCFTMNTSAQAKVSDWHREAVCETHTAEWEHMDFVYLWAVGTFSNGLHLVAWRAHFPTPTEALRGRSLPVACWDTQSYGCQSPSRLAGCRLIRLRRTFLTTSLLLPMPCHASTS
jgi:hypothetical protein